MQPRGRRLGSFETAATLTNEHAPFVVVVVLQLDGGPTPERLAQALAALQARHPPLAVRVVERAGRRWFEREGTPPIPLRRVERSGDDDWMGVAEDELNHAVDAVAGPLVRCTYLPPAAGGARCEIVLAFHHAVMDAASGSILLRQLLELCAAPPPVIGLPLAVEPPAGTPLPPVEAGFPPAFHGVRAGLHLAGFLGRQIADEVSFRRGSRGVARPPVLDPTHCRIVPAALGAELTAALVRASRRRRVTMNAAVDAAFLLALNRHRFGGRPAPIRYLTFADLRPHLRPPVGPDDLGGYISMLRYTARVDPVRGYWELARGLTHQIDAGLRRDKYCFVLLCERIMKTVIARRERMATTAVSYTGVSRLPPRFGALGVRGLHSYVSSFGRGPEYSAQARIFRGELRLDVVYLESEMDREEATAITDDVVAALAAAGAEEEA
jgi:Phthiocerol/phthiodiolone dimycocerosyl transferase C-terminus/Condensation domain